MKVSRKASRRVGTEEGARWGKENSNYSEQALRIRVTGVVTSLVGQSDRFSFSRCTSPQPAHWTFCDRSRYPVKLLEAMRGNNPT